MKGRNGATSFLLSNKKGGLIEDMILEKCLTEDQTKYIYDKVEKGDKITVKRIGQELGNDKMLLHKRLNVKEEINLYEKILVSDVNIFDKNNSQMKQWSILSDNIKYVKSVGCNDVSGIDIKTVYY